MNQTPEYRTEVQPLNYPQVTRQTLRRRAVRRAAPVGVVGILCVGGALVLLIFVPRQSWVINAAMAGLWIGVSCLLVALCMLFNYLDDFMGWWK